jgi:DivIVA domain-containing protein
VALDIHRQIPASFERVQRSDYGYNAKQVGQFLQRARVSLETPEAAAQPVTSAVVRAVSFDPVKGGYSAAVVDAALDRLEDAFARRERDELIAARGEEAWLREIGNLSGILRGRLHRPDGDRRRRRSGATTRPTSTACATNSSPTSNRTSRSAWTTSAAQFSVPPLVGTGTRKPRWTPSWTVWLN